MNNNITGQDARNPQTESDRKGWTYRLCWLVARHPELGIDSDLAAMTTEELWGTCRYVQRIEHEAAEA